MTISVRFPSVIDYSILYNVILLQIVLNTYLRYNLVKRFVDGEEWVHGWGISTVFRLFDFKSNHVVVMTSASCYTRRVNNFEYQRRTGVMTKAFQTFRHESIRGTPYATGCFMTKRFRLMFNAVLCRNSKFISRSRFEISW